MVPGTPGHLGLHALKSKRHRMSLIDEHVDNADQIILGNVVVQMLGAQPRPTAAAGRIAFAKRLSAPLFRHFLGQGLKNYRKRIAMRLAIKPACSSAVCTVFNRSS